MIDEKFYEFTLEVPRLSESSDLIPVTISEKLFTNDDLKLNTIIALAGQFRSYNKIIDGTSKLVLTVFVRELIEVNENMNPNIIEIVGYICKPPIYRTTPFKREICDILVAVNRAYNKSDYIPCICWSKLSLFVSNLQIGSCIRLVGRIQSREYTKDNAEHTAYEVSVNKIEILNNRVAY